MGTTLEQFAAQCHDALKSKPGTEGRKAVCGLVKDVLKDADFVAKYIPDGTPERKVLYEDPELGFTILAHGYVGAKGSKPHDHGPSWAIYGQARGETSMTDFALVESASESRPGKARALRTYRLTPGMAHVYNEGDLHSLKQDGPIRLVRVEGTNLDHVKRFGYQIVT